MKLAETVRAFAGACIVYSAMAACSGDHYTYLASSHDAGEPVVSYDAGLANDAISTPDVAGVEVEPEASAVVDAAPERSIIDALLDPVTEAAAAAPDVSTETCNKSYYPFGDASPPVYYAEHYYPGKLVVDLAHVRVILPGGGIPLYTNVVTLPVLRDAYAATTCTNGSTVTFVLP